jgi:hypothetical protein
MSKVLRGQAVICKHYKIGKERFYAAVKAGAPIRKDGRDWITHVDLLDEWYKQLCGSRPGTPDKGVDGGEGSYG